jgi:hypothetical protein
MKPARYITALPRSSPLSLFRLLFSENNSRLFVCSLALSFVVSLSRLIILMIESRDREAEGQREREEKSYRVRMNPFVVAVVIASRFSLLPLLTKIFHLLDSTKWSSSSHPEHSELVRFNSSTSLQSKNDFVKR